MRYISLLILLTFLGFNGLCQLSYSELDDLNILCKKEDFEAVKIFLKNNEYTITNDRENYDHGNYFVLGEIRAIKKLGEYNDEWFKDFKLDTIYDKIEINLYEYDDYKRLVVDQNHYYKDSFSYSIDRQKFDPLFQWLYEDWDYVKGDDYNTYVDSVWKKEGNGNINSEGYNKYFSNKESMEKPSFGAVFGKNDTKSGEKKEYRVYYDYRDLGDVEMKGKPFLRISTTVRLETLIDKGKNLSGDEDKKLLTFPLIKSGSSYLIKIRFGNILKTYILDSGASDMTLDNETYDFLSSSNEITMKNRLENAKYILADGSIVEFKRLQIPAFSINNIVIKNINAVLVKNGQPLLIGKSFLDSFKSWKIDNKTQQLILQLF